VMLEDSFTVSGPNGQHRCLVFPFLGPSLYSLLLRECLTPAQRRGICKQLASAVAYLHSHDVCHGGTAFRPLAHHRSVINKANANNRPHSLQRCLYNSCCTGTHRKPTPCAPRPCCRRGAPTA
jgi:hypothetical protein